MHLPTSFTCRTTHIFYILKHIFILILWCNENSSVRVSKVKILRSIDGQVDRIRFPRQLCRTTSAQDVGCDVMKERKNQSCSCNCNLTDHAHTLFVKNTVVFGNGSWKCLGSSQVRQLAGCNFLSTGEAVNGPIPEISRKPYYVITTRKRKCRINALKSAFLTCNGTWKLLNESVLKRFVNTSNRFTKDQVVIKYTGGTKPHRSVKGKVIRLAVSCRKRRQNQNVGCIVMKVKGNLRCPMVSSPKPTDGAKVNTFTKASNKVTRKTAVSSMLHLHRPKVGAIKKKQKNVKKRDGVADKTAVHSLAVTMGAFAVVILAIVGVSAFVVMVMRRKLNNDRSQCN